MRLSNHRSAEISKRYSSLKQNTSGSGSAEAILEQLQKEVKELQSRVGLIDHSLYIVMGTVL